MLSLNVVNLPNLARRSLLAYRSTRLREIFAGNPDISTKKYPCNYTSREGTILTVGYLRIQLYPLFVFFSVISSEVC